MRAVRETSAAPPPAPETQVSPELTSRLIEACAAARPLRLVYRLGPAGERQREREMEIGPVGVFVDAHLSDEWEQTRPFLQAIQAHGNEPPQFLDGITRHRRIKVFRIAGEDDLDGVEAYALDGAAIGGEDEVEAA